MNAVRAMDVGGNTVDTLPTARKRAASDQNNNNDAGVKRRSSRACLSCRTRKVRCDMFRRFPCTNCHLDEIECIPAESNRGRRPTTSRAATANSPHGPSRQARPPSRPPISRPDDYCVSLPFEGQQRHRSPSEFANEIHVANQIRSHAVASLGRDADDAFANASPKNQNRVASHYSCDETAYPRLPSCFRPLPSKISQRDYEYLADKGALAIPDKELRDELLRIYVNIVYAYMPAIDLEEFLGPILRSDSRSTVSLILFQAVMFASVTFADLTLLQRRGFQTRKEARKVFFSRAQLLHSLDCEPDRLALIQAVLLMTYWYDCPDENQDTWYWMGIALSLAQLVGLHQDPEQLKISPEKKRHRRRLWWSCVIRDRLLALGLRRPARIREEDFNVPPLTLDDFELTPPSKPLVQLLGESPFTGRDPEARKTVAIMIIDLSKLCLCIGHILYSQYTVADTYQGTSEYLLKVVIRPRQSQERVRCLAKCDKELEGWLESQDPQTRYLPNSQESSKIGDKATRITRLHQALLHMIYLTAVGALHRPQVFYSDSNSDDTGISRQESKNRVSKAAIDMSELAFDLHSSNQLCYLSTSSVPAFLSASLIHLLDSRSPNENERNVNMGRFYQCVYILQQLQDIYASADDAVRFLETVLQNSELKLPVIRLGISAPPVRDSDYSVSRPTAQNISLSRLDTAYPSPSSSRTQLHGETAARNQNIPATEMQQTHHSLSNAFDGWPVSDGQYEDSQDQPSEIISESPYIGDWMDLDGFLPALLNYDASGNLLIGNTS